jgi:hypothetical protein
MLAGPPKMTMRSASRPVTGRTPTAGRRWGARPPREHHWARIAIEAGAPPSRGHWLLARRCLADPDEIAYYACYGAARSRLVDLAWVAGRRWHITAVSGVGGRHEARGYAASVAVR